jgi:acetate kinase
MIEVVEHKNIQNRMAVNVGSSSIKTAMFYAGNRIDVNINFIGLSSQTIKVKFNMLKAFDDETYKVYVGDDLSQAAALIIDKVQTVLELISWPEPNAIGHRVKFAGFGPSVEKIKKETELVLEFNDYLSSRHNALCLDVVRKAMDTFPKAIQFMVRDQVVNDLSLHKNGRIPFEKSLIRRYGLYANGYHGLAVKACLKELNQRYDVSSYNGIICQIGSGVSVSAVIRSNVKYNSMQFAACDGPIMHNRAGTQPTGLALRFLKYGLDSRSLSNVYNRLSGIYGLADLPANSNITVEDILSIEEFEGAKEAYLNANAVELFKAIAEVSNLSNFVFSGGLATKHRWIGPELLYRARLITSETKEDLIQQLKDEDVLVASGQGLYIYLVDIDEQSLILDEIEAYSSQESYFDFFAAVCEVPGTSVGIVREGREGWGDGKICLNFQESAFSFDVDNLPEAFIFCGTDRDDFFMRSVFARSMNVPAIFINVETADADAMIGKNFYMDTPTRTVVKL